MTGLRKQQSEMDPVYQSERRKILLIAGITILLLTLCYYFFPSASAASEQKFHFDNMLDKHSVLKNVKAVASYATWGFQEHLANNIARYYKGVVINNETTSAIASALTVFGALFVFINTAIQVGKEIGRGEITYESLLRIFTFFILSLILVTNTSKIVNVLDRVGYTITAQTTSSITGEEPAELSNMEGDDEAHEELSTMENNQQPKSLITLIVDGLKNYNNVWLENKERNKRQQEQLEKQQKEMTLYEDFKNALIDTYGNGSGRGNDADGHKFKSNYTGSIRDMCHNLISNFNLMLLYFVLGITIRLTDIVFFSILIELVLRKAFAPIAMAECARSGFEGAGFEFFKGYAALYIRIAMMYVIAMADALILTELVKDLKTSAFWGAIEIVILNITVFKMFTATGSLANTIMGGR